MGISIMIMPRYKLVLGDTENLVHNGWVVSGILTGWKTLNFTLYHCRIGMQCIHIFIHHEKFRKQKKKHNFFWSLCCKSIRLFTLHNQSHATCILELCSCLVIIVQAEYRHHLNMHIISNMPILTLTTPFSTLLLLLCLRFGPDYISAFLMLILNWIELLRSNWVTCCWCDHWITDVYFTFILIHHNEKNGKKQHEINTKTKKEKKAQLT